MALYLLSSQFFYRSHVENPAMILTMRDEGYPEQGTMAGSNQLPVGAYDRQPADFDYTAGQDQTTITVRLITCDITDGLRVDDITSNEVTASITAVRQYLTT